MDNNSELQVLYEDFGTYSDSQNYLKQIHSLELDDNSYQITWLSNLNTFTT